MLDLPATLPTARFYNDVSAPEAPRELASRPRLRMANTWLAVSTWIDRAIALALLVPALPVIGLLVLVVRLTSPGPGIFSQRRVGRDGREFTMYKLRSMRNDAERHTGAVWCRPGDARVTRIGRILRATHLDELPQLFNVLRGDMDLVGPRPERPESTPNLEQRIPGYNRRHAVRPGITGLAQINLPPDTDLDSVRRKLQLDLAYVREASLWLDVRILLCTALKLLGVDGKVAAAYLGIRRNVVLPEELTATESRDAEFSPWTPGPSQVFLSLRPKGPRTAGCERYHRAG